MRPAMLALAAIALSACSTTGPQDRFWDNLSALCGRAYEGKVAANAGGAPGPDPFDGKKLVMHVRRCSETEIRVPFHVGEDRSRTWVFTRSAAGLRLKHDHRHRDGSDDKATMYGGDTVERGAADRQSFPADESSRAMFVRDGIPQSAANIWVVGLVTGRTYGYGLNRPGREFRVDFDLTRDVPAPPPPWGAE